MSDTKAEEVVTLDIHLKLPNLNGLKLLGLSLKKYHDNSVIELTDAVIEALEEMDDAKVDKSDVANILTETILYENKITTSEAMSLTCGLGLLSDSLMTSDGNYHTIELSEKYKSEQFKQYRFVILTVLNVHNMVETIYVDLNTFLSIPYTSNLTSIDTLFRDGTVSITKKEATAWNDTTDSLVQINISGGCLLRLNGYK